MKINFLIVEGLLAFIATIIFVFVVTTRWLRIAIFTAFIFHHFVLRYRIKWSKWNE